MTRETYPDPARWAERDTDAGTKPAIPDPGHVDDRPYTEYEDDDEPPPPARRKFRVWLRSAPGMWALYDGCVDCWAASRADAFRAAVRELARTSFPDRPSLGSWVHERTEELP